MKVPPLSPLLPFLSVPTCRILEVLPAPLSVPLEYQRLISLLLSSSPQNQFPKSLIQALFKSLTWVLFKIQAPSSVSPPVSLTTLPLRAYLPDSGGSPRPSVCPTGVSAADLLASFLISPKSISQILNSSTVQIPNLGTVQNSTLGTVRNIILPSSTSPELPASSGILGSSPPPQKEPSNLGGLSFSPQSPVTTATNPNGIVEDSSRAQTPPPPSSIGDPKPVSTAMEIDPLRSPLASTLPPTTPNPTPPCPLLHPPQSPTLPSSPNPLDSPISPCLPPLNYVLALAATVMPKSSILPHTVNSCAALSVPADPPFPLPEDVFVSQAPYLITNDVVAFPPLSSSKWESPKRKKKYFTKLTTPPPPVKNS
ncbi:hypothetical protein HID58_005629, partial [Brassica napus]